MAITTNREIYHGENTVLPYTMDPIPGGGINGWTIRMFVRDNFDRNGTDSLMLEAAGAVEGDGTAGEFSVTLSEAQTGQLPVGNYTYAIWRTDVGFSVPLAIGNLIVRDGNR